MHPPVECNGPDEKEGQLEHARHLQRIHGIDERGVCVLRVGHARRDGWQPNGLAMAVRVEGSKQEVFHEKETAKERICKPSSSSRRSGPEHR
eukprot:CAMPEP_0114634714 /NCGR_PEP_ID=MMETSP0168-20121206/16116_1 /TAXON_ID=95228 ORGANISM="Vannella sp., Strain DIVA3 517/6/12" /NCGR_SAMPLE_ID=MMETSP0168 /ASSEMBLY_ACC=CAM_ASM_000044 /LENGTH=91 /DNA_ID=CAMNT_0001846411 /DNA_START=636 /DNA_END=911 /DNA_ORIENTATION=-